MAIALAVGRYRVGGVGQHRACVLLDLQLGHVAAVALRQTGRAFVEGEAVDVAVLADAARFARLGRVIPGPFADPHHALAHILGEQGAHQDLAALVEGTHQIPLGDAASLGIQRDGS